LYFVFVFNFNNFSSLLRLQLFLFNSNDDGAPRTVGTNLTPTNLTVSSEEEASHSGAAEESSNASDEKQKAEAAAAAAPAAAKKEKRKAVKADKEESGAAAAAAAVTSSKAKKKKETVADDDDDDDAPAADDDKQAATLARNFFFFFFFFFFSKNLKLFLSLSNSCRHFQTSYWSFQRNCSQIGCDVDRLVLVQSSHSPHRAPKESTIFSSPPYYFITFLINFLHIFSKGLTELIVPSRSKVKGAPLNDSELQLNVIENFCTYLERYALGIDGIFSQAVSEQIARNIAQMLNQDSKTIDFQAIVEPPELVAAALLQYLESHKKTMIPSKNYDAFIAANSEAKNEKRIERLRDAVVGLPAANRAICGRLIRLLYAIAENKDFTGQDAGALGGLFGDTLLHNKGSTGEAASGADLIAFMIENYYTIVFQAEYEAERKEKKEYDFEVGLTESDWKLLLTNAKLYKYKLDQVVLNEGEPNTQLFRVRKGEFKVVKKGKHIATLEPLAMFGEISFLGSYIAEATVSAAVDEAELWILDLKFVQQMFAMEPELAMKFYHFIGSYLAKRLLHVSGGTGDPFVAKTESFVRVAPPAQRPAGEITPLTEELVIKDYPCKLDKDGTLYIMQHYLSHFAPMFGRERKKIIPYDYVTSLTMADNLKELLIVRKQKNKVSRLEFHNTQDCDEAFALIETMLLNRRRDAPYPTAEHHSRAVALYDFQGQHEHDLSFKVKDVIVVLQKRPDGWWLGERRGVLGYFPATYVRDDEGLPTLHDWEIVWLGGATKELKKGDAIVKQDERAGGLFQILSGQCEVVRDGKTAATLNKDETFGEVSYLGRTVSPDGVVAASKATVREIPGAWLDKLFKNSPALASRVFKYLAVVLEMKLRVILEPPPTKAEIKAAEKAAEKAAKKSDKKSSKKAADAEGEGEGETAGAVTARDHSDEEGEHHHHHHHGHGHHAHHHHHHEGDDEEHSDPDAKKEKKHNKRKSGEKKHKRKSAELK
jgi:CRP-like cAMP-binding protein